MAISKIQFQHGMGLSEFFQLYGTEEQCKKALLNARWPHGYNCDQCGNKHAISFNAKSTTYWQCCKCRYQTSLRSGTIFHGSKLPLTKWFQAIFLIGQSKNNVSAMELYRHLKISYTAAWRMKHKLMQVMLEQEADRKLQGDVVIDDAYLGGERPGKRGRGSENKAPFIAAVQMDNNHPLLVRFDLVSGFTKDAVVDWAKKYLNKSSNVVSDGLQCFTAVTQIGAAHSREIVGENRRSTDMPCFKWINILLSNLKTAISGTYHAFDFMKYAPRYLAERQFLFNFRFNLKDIFRTILTGCITTGPRPEKWLRSS